MTTQPRLPWADLRALVDARGLSMSQLARESGIARRVILRWKAEGALPERAADRMAVAIGLTPELVWGEAWARLGREAVEAKRAARLERDRRQAREYKDRHREKVRAYNRQYHHDNAAGRKRERQARYWRNADAERARQREYDRRKAAAKREMAPDERADNVA